MGQKNLARWIAFLNKSAFIKSDSSKLFQNKSIHDFMVTSKWNYSYIAFIKLVNESS